MTLYSYGTCPLRKQKGFPSTMALKNLYKAETVFFRVFRSKEYAETFDARGTASSASISPSKTLRFPALRSSKSYLVMILHMIVKESLFLANGFERILKGKQQKLRIALKDLIYWYSS